MTQPPTPDPTRGLWPTNPAARIRLPLPPSPKPPHTCPFPPQETLHAAAEPSRPLTHPPPLFIPPPSPVHHHHHHTPHSPHLKQQPEDSSTATSPERFHQLLLSSNFQSKGYHGDAGREEEGAGRGGGAQPAAGLPLPPHRRRAGGALPVPQGRRAAPARAHHRRGRPLPLRPLGAPRPRPLRHPRVVLLHPARPQVPQRLPPQPRRRQRLLEGHRRRQARRAPRGADHGHQEGPRVLRREGAQGGQDRLDHARVPPRRRRPRRRQQEGLAQAGRLGALPPLQQEERVGEDAAAAAGGRGDDDDGAQGGEHGVRHGRHLALPLAVPVALALVGRGAHAGVGDRGQRPVPVPAGGGVPDPEPRGRRGAPGDDGHAHGAQEGGGGRGRQERPVRGPQLRRHPEHVQRARHDAARGRPAILLPLRLPQGEGEPARRRRHAGPVLSRAKTETVRDLRSTEKENG